jgi:hypothetical protein
MYVLEKISILKGQQSMVGQGYTKKSDKVHTFLAGEEEPEEIRNVQGIVVGKQVLVGRGLDYLHTSPVQEILETGEDYVRFKTSTSIYELRKED